jgi:hypothetical protein
MATLTAVYMADLARVRLEADDLMPEVVYSIERSADGGVTWSTVRGATNITDGGVTVVYDYEYAPNVENLYQLVQPLISDTFERTVGPAALVLPNASGAYASAPDAAALDITGNIDISGIIRFGDYSDGSIQTIKAKYTTTGNQRSYNFRVSATGFLQFVFSVNGTSGNTATATVSLYAAGVADGDIIAVRATRVAATGVITFYLGSEPSLDPGTWNTVGATVSGTTGNLFAGTAPLEVGSSNSGTADLADGRIIATRLRNGIAPAGTIVADPNFADQPTGTTSFADTAGNTWTVNGAATIEGNDEAWGEADTGQLWTLYDDYVSFGNRAIWFVEDGAGRVISLFDFGFDQSRYLAGTIVTDAEVQHDVIIEEGLQQTRLSVRGTSASNFTGYQVVFTPDETSGLVELGVFTNDGPAQVIDVDNWQIGQRWRVKVRVVGTVIEAKTWNTANPEPGTWQLVTTSTNAASGLVGLSFNLTDPGGYGITDNFIVHQVPPLAVADAAVTPEQADVWLKSIAFPSLNQNLGCIRTTARTRRSRVGLFDVKGRHAILGIADVGSTETFTMSFATHSQEQNVAITALLTFGPPLLLQSPPDADPTGCGNLAAYPSGWFMPGDNIEARPLLGRPLWEWQVPLTRVAPPSAQEIIPAHMTWAVLWQMVNNWVELWDEWGTWAELWNATVAPTALYQALSGGEG